MKDRLEGKTAVVVGASSGIGKATATLLAGHGAMVVCLARGADRLEGAVAEIGEGARGISCDASDPDDVRRAFDTVHHEFGRLDMVLNVLGAARPARLEDATDAEIALHIATNLLAPIYSTRAAIPLLRASGGGDILNVSSEVTIDLFPMLTLYGTTKAGLEMFTRAMTKELKPDNIRVTLFIAGKTESEFGRDWDPARVAAARDAWDADGCNRRVAGLRQMDPATVAEAILFAVTRPRSQMVDIMQVRSFS